MSYAETVQKYWYGGQERNHINREFSASKPFEKLATDVTEFSVCDQKVYLSPVLDLYNSEIVSYDISRSPNFRQTKEMLNGLFKRLPLGATPMLHSDQGGNTKCESFKCCLKSTTLLKVCPAKEIVLTTVSWRIFSGG